MATQTANGSNGSKRHLDDGMKPREEVTKGLEATKPIVPAIIDNDDDDNFSIVAKEMQRAKRQSVKKLSTRSQDVAIAKEAITLYIRKVYDNETVTRRGIGRLARGRFKPATTDGSRPKFAFPSDFAVVSSDGSAVCEYWQLAHNANTKPRIAKGSFFPFAALGKWKQALQGLVDDSPATSTNKLAGLIRDMTNERPLNANKDAITKADALYEIMSASILNSAPTKAEAKRARRYRAQLQALLPILSLAPSLERFAKLATS